MLLIHDNCNSDAYPNTYFGLYTQLHGFPSALAHIFQSLKSQNRCDLLETILHYDIIYYATCRRQWNYKANSKRYGCRKE